MVRSSMPPSEPRSRSGPHGCQRARGPGRARRLRSEGDLGALAWPRPPASPAAVSCSDEDAASRDPDTIERLLPSRKEQLLLPGRQQLTNRAQRAPSRRNRHEVAPVAQGIERLRPGCGCARNPLYGFRRAAHGVSGWPTLASNEPRTVHVLGLCLPSVGNASTGNAITRKSGLGERISSR